MIENQNQETEKPLIANVRNPNLWPEPNTIKNQQLLKYISMDEIKLQHSYLNYKRSGKYIGISYSFKIFHFNIRWNLSRMFSS